jgi:3-oxoacyl-[acyl-carrier-protein] synthase II
MSELNERVVITGVGAISSVGATARATFQALAEGRSGIREHGWKLPEGMEARVGGIIENFEYPEIEGCIHQSVGRYTHLALTAAREAAEDSGILSAGYESSRIATIMGVGLGNGEALMTATEQVAKGQELSLAWGDCVAPHVASELVAAMFGATGPSCCLQSACASSAHAIGYGFDQLRYGLADVVVVGGAEAPVSPFGLALFERIGALTKWTGPATGASRPFERDRSGFVMGEGAGMLVLETLSNAQRRGAKIYAEVAGYGATADAFHVTRPQADGRGMAKAINRALRIAKVDPSTVDYVNAHGTGTEFNDEAETMALKEVFGAHASNLWVSSNKSMIGHLLGAAAAVETVAAVYTIATGTVPPTINLDNPDKDCDLDYVPHVAREKAVRVAIKNSFGFGGQNASLVLKSV